MSEVGAKQNSSIFSEKPRGLFKTLVEHEAKFTGLNGVDLKKVEEELGKIGYTKTLEQKEVDIIVLGGDANDCSNKSGSDLIAKIRIGKNVVSIFPQLHTNSEKRIIIINIPRNAFSEGFNEKVLKVFEGDYNSIPKLVKYLAHKGLLSFENAHIEVVVKENVKHLEKPDSSGKTIDYVNIYTNVTKISIAPKGGEIETHPTSLGNFIEISAKTKEALDEKIKIFSEFLEKAIGKKVECTYTHFFKMGNGKIENEEGGAGLRIRE